MDCFEIFGILLHKATLTKLSTTIATILMKGVKYFKICLIYFKTTLIEETKKLSVEKVDYRGATTPNRTYGA